jgi:hypothetical protein
MPTIFSFSPQKRGDFYRYYFFLYPFAFVIYLGFLIGFNKNRVFVVPKGT